MPFAWLAAVAMHRGQDESAVNGFRDVIERPVRNWSDSVRLDLRYVANWSPSPDLLIFCKTASAVLRGSGAY